MGERPPESLSRFGLRSLLGPCEGFRTVGLRFVEIKRSTREDSGLLGLLCPGRDTNLSPPRTSSSFEVYPVEVKVDEICAVKTHTKVKSFSKTTIFIKTLVT